MYFPDTPYSPCMSTPLHGWPTSSYLWQ